MKTATQRANGKAKKQTGRHKICFTVNRAHCNLDDAVQEVQVLIRARNGWHTEAIANDLGLTPSQVDYRIKKGLAIGARKDFRNGDGWVAQAALQATASGIVKDVADKVSPQYR
jgi:hypothetical protein